MITPHDPLVVPAKRVSQNKIYLSAESIWKAIILVKVRLARLLAFCLAFGESLEYAHSSLVYERSERLKLPKPEVKIQFAGLFEDSKG
jgi:CRISPR/Cas system CSM-associated protein Csm4 (group 5 of RAMP superfamily)